MVQRLGYVLYWTGCIVGLALGGLSYVALTGPESNNSTGEVAAIVAGTVIVPWAIGWACRYVLAGH
jgi:hypothetical protein